MCLGGKWINLGPEAQPSLCVSLWGGGGERALDFGCLRTDSKECTSLIIMENTYLKLNGKAWYYLVGSPLEVVGSGVCGQFGSFAGGAPGA